MDHLPCSDRVALCCVRAGLPSHGDVRAAGRAHFGPGFNSGAKPLTILSIGMSAEVLAGPALLALLMGGRSRRILAITALGFVVNLTLNLKLIPIWGMTGAALAWTASIVLVNTLALGQIHRLWGISPFDRTFLLVVTSAALCYGCGGLIGAQVAGQTVPTLIVTAALATVLYGAILWLLRARLAPGTAIAAMTAGAG